MGYLGGRAIGVSRPRRGGFLVPNTKPVDAAPRTEHEDTLIALGARVRELRARRSLTLEGLSDITGLSSSMISLVERGRTSPSIGTLVVIAAGLGVSIPD